MTTASFHRLPNLRTYAQALDRYNTTKPIRGRSPEVRPLGARKDVDRFKIDKRENGDVVCILFRTDFLTFHPDNSITIDLGGYKPSLSDAYFVEEVLAFRACIQRRALVIEPINTANKWRVVLTNEAKTLTFVRDEQNVLMPSKEYAVKGWTIDRAASNEVRKKYGEFYRYLKTALSLRKDEETGTVIAVSALEMKQSGAFPIEYMDEDTYKRLKDNGTLSGHNRWLGMDVSTAKDITKVWRIHDAALNTNPLEGKRFNSGSWVEEMREQSKSRWYANVNHFEALINTEGKSDEQVHNDMYQAFMWLTFWAAQRTKYKGLYTIAQHSYWADDDYARDVTYHSTCAHMRSGLDKLLFMLHSNHVLKYTELKPGQTPNPAYAKWID